MGIHHGSHLLYQSQHVGFHLFLYFLLVTHRPRFGYGAIGMPWGALSYGVFPKKTKCEEYEMRNECMLKMECGSDLIRTVLLWSKIMG